MVAIAIERPSRRVLHLAEVWKSWNPECTHGNHELLIALKEEDSRPLFLSPRSNAPHTLIAGSTGSGKSVLMQNIILGIACTNTPEQARIVLIDPKLGVDYFAFERLPLLWIIHDEFAEWMLTPEYAGAVQDIVCRLGVKARAAGISLVFGAQRPDANVMPMQLRANLGNRLVLRVDGEGTSEIALGERGAERLLGKGHLAARLDGGQGIVYGQVPYVQSGFLTEVVANSRARNQSQCCRARPPRNSAGLYVASFLSRFKMPSIWSRLREPRPSSTNN